MPLVVLVNGGTASAAEILSGALQDHDRAVVLGTPTFGKGVAYLLIPLTETEAVTVTSSRWYTPSGRSIQRGRSGSRNMALMAARSIPIDTTPREYRSDGGRLLDAGDGGIQPDVIVADTLTDKEKLFVQTLGQQFPEYRNAMTRYALELKGQNAVTDPDFVTTDGMLSTILQSLRTAGIEMPDSIFDGAREWISQQFGFELTRYAFGRQAEIRRSARTDAQISRAIALLQEAESTTELLELAQRR